MYLRECNEIYFYYVQKYQKRFQYQYVSYDIEQHFKKKTALS